MNHNIPKLSPFKLLRPYDKKDIKRYFGRKKETRQLYEALMRSKFMMVYGASGTGKTSLVQCGLQSMFSPRDWMPVLVRRREDFLGPIREELTRRYLELFADYQKQQLAWYPDEEPPQPEEFENLRDLIQALFNLSYVPIYLILDQFEEIFTIGDKEEQEAFFEELSELKLFSEDLFCKIIIVTREEYIAHFYRHENRLPFLFEYRFRVEKMRQEQLLEVVEGTLSFPYKDYPKFVVQEGASPQILDNLTDERSEVDLTTLQVYLDRLYQEDYERNPGRDHVLFDQQLVGENKLENVLSDFLDRQVERISKKLSANKKESKIPLQVLFQMVTTQGTKQSRSAEEIYDILQVGKTEATLDQVHRCLEEFASPESRILNRLKYAKSDAERFEIMHDRLAAQLFSKFNVDELRRREAVTTIRNKIKRYNEANTPQEKNSEYLSVGEIELVKQALNTERLEEELRDFYNASQEHIDTIRRKERRRLVLSGIAAVFFALVAGVAVIFYNQANAATEKANAATKEAQENLLEAQKNLLTTLENKYDNMIKRAEGFETTQSYEYALYDYQQADVLWKDTLKALYWDEGIGPIKKNVEEDYEALKIAIDSVKIKMNTLNDQQTTGE